MWSRVFPCSLASTDGGSGQCGRVGIFSGLALRVSGRSAAGTLCAISAAGRDQQGVDAGLEGTLSAHARFSAQHLLNMLSVAPIRLAQDHHINLDYLQRPARPLDGAGHRQLEGFA